jgi:hypothetical protein
VTRRVRLRDAATAYPYSGKVGGWTGDRAEDVVVRRRDAVEYYDGEV